jgi:peptide/nickel transport system substrate-binding protein
LKRGIIGIALTCLIMTTFVLASCASKTSTTTTTTTSTSTAPTSTSTSIVTSTTTSTSTAPVTSIVTTTSTGNWWDSLGTPQYGGKITWRINSNITSFDPYNGSTPTQVYTGWMEQLLAIDWTINPAIENYQLSFWDSSFAVGQLLKSWEFTSPGVLVLHVKQGIYWQNIAPTFGREFTSADIVYHFNRMLGLGSGYTKPEPSLGTTSTWAPLTSVTASDNWTVTMNWSTTNPEVAIENLTASNCQNTIEDPDAVTAYGNLNNWHNAIGTGPFLLTDFVDGSSLVMVKNPNYWQNDERYPQNRLPYVDQITYLVIPDTSTALAAFRAGKIDELDSIANNQAQDMQKTNPNVVQIPVPIGNTVTMDPRNDKPPFNDVRVREALQMAIDLPTIAQTYYGGGATKPWPSTLTSNYMTGWGFPYNQWPADLQAQYAYNTTQAKALLSAAGYPNGFTTDIIFDTSGDSDLLQIIQSEFAVIGVNMAIRPMVDATFSSYVITGHNQDAMIMRQPGAGTIGLTFYPLRQVLRFQTGYSVNTAMVSDPVYDAFPPAATGAISTDALKTVMTSANKYVAQQHFVISLLQQMQFSLCQPWFKGYNGQSEMSGASAGPQLLFFYGARFWIDKSLQ